MTHPYALLTKITYYAGEKVNDLLTFLDEAFRFHRHRPDATRPQMRKNCLQLIAIFPIA